MTLCDNKLRFLVKLSVVCCSDRVLFLVVKPKQHIHYPVRPIERVCRVFLFYGSIALKSRMCDHDDFWIRIFAGLVFVAKSRLCAV